LVWFGLNSPARTQPVRRQFAADRWFRVN
jgi:hypothetical protein